MSKTMNDNSIIFDLADPDQARSYIRQVRIGKDVPNYVTTTEGRLIHFSNMSNDDAIFVAHEFWDMQCKAEGRKP